MMSFLFGREEEERVTGKNSKQAESPAFTKNRTQKKKKKKKNLYKWLTSL